MLHPPRRRPPANSQTSRFNRPLLQIQVNTFAPLRPRKFHSNSFQVTATSDVLGAPLSLQDAKTRYVQLVPRRPLFRNITRKLLSNAAQVTPSIRDEETQTTLSVPTNSWIRYEYEYQSPDFTPDQAESFHTFLRRFTDYVCDQVAFQTTPSPSILLFPSSLVVAVERYLGHLHQRLWQFGEKRQRHSVAYTRQLRGTLEFSRRTARR